MGHIAGVEGSQQMVAQARARNEKAIERRRVDLSRGSVGRLPFQDNTFQEALAINSMQVWPDAIAGPQEMRRVVKAGGTVALAFKPAPRGVLAANPAGPPLDGGGVPA